MNSVSSWLVDRCARAACYASGSPHGSAGDRWTAWLAQARRSARLKGRAALWFALHVLWLAFATLGVSAGQGLVTPQLTQAPAPNVQDTPVPSPVTLPDLPLPSPDVPNRPLTADEAAGIALRLQPAITVARGGITAAQGLTQQANSALLPNVSAGLGYTHVQQVSGSGTGGGTTAGGASSTSTGFSGAVTLQQLIYDFNHTRDLVREYHALERAAIQNLSLAQQQTVFQVKQAFYQYVEYRQLVRVNDANVSNRQAQLALANARLKAGLGLAADVVTAQTAVSEAVQSSIGARNNANTGRINLDMLMGVDPRTPIEPATSSEPLISFHSMSDLVQTALRQRPEVLQTQATLQAGQSALSAARTYNAPIIAGTLGSNSRGSQFFPQNDTFSVGVAVQFSVFDGGMTAGRIKEAHGNLESAQAQLRTAQLTVTSDVSQSYTNLQSADQRVTAAGSEIVNATEGVRIATGRYRAGLGQFVDILNAQQFLYTAQTDLETAQFAAEQARVALARAIGAPIGGAQNSSVVNR